LAGADEQGDLMRGTLVAILGALSAVAQGQDFSHLQIEKVAGNQRFTEGPVWAREGYLIFSDVPSNRLLKIGPEGVSVVRDNSNGAYGNTFDAQGRLYTCESRTRRVVRMDPKGRVQVLAEKWDGKRLNAPNDIVVRKDGHVYFTDPAFGSQQDTRELDFYGVYHVNPKGELSVVAKPKGRPNGITVSPNGRILYVTDSDSRTVLAFDLDRQGAASNEHILVRGVPGVPGGIRTDEKGNLYVACKGIAVYSPDGQRLTVIELSEGPSNLAFGEDDFSTLFVTARSSVYRMRVGVKGAVQY
jgi:gluconolactonase